MARRGDTRHESFSHRATNPAALVAFLVATGAGVVLSASAAGGAAILLTRWGLFWRLVLWAGTWVVAVVAALRLPARTATALIVCGAIAIRLAALAGPPTTSDDLYRYGWDGRVQAAGIDPYREPPSSPALARLREPWLWPAAAGCAALRRPPGCTRLNRPTVRTIYPPVAEAWFATVYRIAGIGARHKAWQVAGLLTDMATVGLLILALPRWGHDRRWVALYALCPAPVFEFVHNGHVDGLAVAFVVGALVVAAGGRGAAGGPATEGPATGGVAAGGVAAGGAARIGASRCRPDRASAWRDVAIGLLIGAAMLVKLYPAIVLVALLGLRRAHPWRATARAAAAATALTVLTYLPHVIVAGTRVLGYLPGYLKEEHYDKGGRFLIPAVLGFPPRASEAIAAAGLAAAVVWVAWRRPTVPRGAAVLLAALFLAVTPVQPWYAVSLLAVATLAGWHWPEYLAPAAIVAAGYAYYFAVVLDYRHTVVLGRAAYGTALAIAVVTGAGGRSLRRRASAAKPRS